ncbi:hypothetical protein [Leifsonia sp. 22587]|uniref:hypothetical protein n=1 Tax=Leifsonia sp. 22587 TaxID=3453946 RepID=UPI003F84D8A2
MAIALLVTGCGGGSRLSLLARGASEASSELRPLSDDLLHAAQKGAVKTPSALEDAAAGIPASGLSDAERAAAARVERWVKVIAFWNGAVKWSTGWETGLGDEATGLVGAALIADAKPAFRQQVDDLTERLLRNLTCQTARKYIDAAAQEAEGESGLLYDPAVPSDRPAIEDFARGVLYADWDDQGVEAAIDLAALAVSIVGTVQTWEKTLRSIIDSPDGTIRQANIFYLRSCVAKV